MFGIDMIKNFADDAANSVMQTVYVLTLIACACAIAATIVLSLLKLRKKNSAVAVLLSSIICVFISIPMTTAFNHIVSIQSLKNVSAQAQAKRLELENQQLEYQKRQLEIEQIDRNLQIASLKEEIDVLKNAQMSLQNFGKICEVALLEAQLKQAEVRIEQLGEASSGTIENLLEKSGVKSKLGMAEGKDRYTDEVLVITMHDINAKFGIDLNDVRVKKVDDNTLNICGLSPKYIGSDKNISDTKISEIRHNKYTNNVKVSTSISESREDMQRAANLAQEYEKEFQNRLSQGAELKFMDESVIKLGQNFLTVILSSLGMNLTFNNNDTTDSVPIMEYFENELSQKENEMTTSENTAE